MDICVSEGTVYIAGYEKTVDDLNRACYWYDDGDGITQVLLGEFGAFDLWSAIGIRVESGTVYTLGDVYLSPGTETGCLWSDTTLSEVTAGSEVTNIHMTAIEVLDGHAYISGWGDTDVPCSWTWSSSAGFSRLDLPVPGGSGRACGIFVVE